MPEKFDWQQNYAGGQQAYEQAMNQKVQDWQGTHDFGTRGQVKTIPESSPQQTGLGGLLAGKNPGWMGENPNAGLFGLGLMGGAPRELSNPDQPFVYDPGPRKEAIPTSPSRTVVADTRNSFVPPPGNAMTEEEQQQLGDDMFGETMGGYGEQLGGFGDQINNFEEQIGGFNEQFGGFDKSITNITNRLSGIEEGIASLKTSDNKQSNPYSRMNNPFSFLGYWGGRR